MCASCIRPCVNSGSFQEPGDVGITRPSEARQNLEQIWALVLYKNKVWVAELAAWAGRRGPEVATVLRKTRQVLRVQALALTHCPHRRQSIPHRQEMTR